MAIPSFLGVQQIDKRVYSQYNCVIPQKQIAVGSAAKQKQKAKQMARATWAHTIGSLVAAAVVVLGSAAGIAVPRAYGATSLEVGVFEPGAAWDTSKITAVENSVGVTFSVAKWYQDWGETFDASVPPRLAAAGYKPELTWEPMVSGTGVSYAAVASGSYDSYLAATANAVKGTGTTIRINLAAEMNGDWSPYYIGTHGTTSDFQNFWRHVVTVFRNQGATNVEWVWTPNVHYWGEAYSYASFYPGDAYVTYLGLDGYNWGTSQSWSTWQSFAQVFDSSYRDLATLSNKQILIMETASSESGGSKAQWISDMFSTVPQNYPRIKGITWFDQNKETDWRIQSSAAASIAFKNGMNGAIVVTSTPTPAPTAAPKPTARPTATPVPVNGTVSATPSPTIVPTASPETQAAGTAVVTATILPTPAPSPVRATIHSRKFDIGGRTVANASVFQSLVSNDPATQLKLLVAAEVLLLVLFLATSRAHNAQLKAGMPVPLS